MSDQNKPASSPADSSRTRGTGGTREEGTTLEGGGPVRRWLGRYQVVLWTTGILVAISTLLRITLLLIFADPSGLSVMQLAEVFWVGLRFDLLVALVFQLPQVLHMTTTGNARIAGRMSRIQVHVGLFLTFAFALFISVSEYFFFEEFDSRFNYIAFEYLVYPTEVAANIQQSYPLWPVLGGISVASLLLYLALRKLTRRSLPAPLPWRRRYAMLGLTLVAIGGLWMTTGRKSVEITNNRVVNQVAYNGLWTFVENAWTSRFDYENYYPTIDPAEALQRVKERVFAATDKPTGEGLNRVVTSPRPRKDYNVVLVLEESLGSDFIGVLGDGRGLSPNFDRVSQRGILFDRFFATGNRTARALEATLTALPPIPTESILKRDHSERVTSLARILADRDYRRLFVYGGRGLFDGMRSFMLNNGFEHFVEQSDFDNPEFTTAWGVSDEAIFDRALIEFDKLHDGGKPFFATVLTVSNHQPYTYPEGRIDLDPQERRRDNAVKYADYALGRFLDQAQSHAFYDNTVFVVLGDHGARVYGAQMFPLKSYRVPVLMILPGGEAAGTRCSTLASTLDIAPTIMGLLGGAYESVFFGRDALNLPAEQGYALMQHNHDLALLENDNTVTMLRLSDEPVQYKVDPKTFVMDQGTVDPDRRDDAISFFQLANYLYYNDAYFPSAAPQTPRVAEASEH